LKKKNEGNEEEKVGEEEITGGGERKKRRKKRKENHHRPFIFSRRNTVAAPILRIRGEGKGEKEKKKRKRGGREEGKEQGGGERRKGKGKRGSKHPRTGRCYVNGIFNSTKDTLKNTTGAPREHFRGREEMRKKGKRCSLLEAKSAKKRKGKRGEKKKKKKKREKGSWRLAKNGKTKSKRINKKKK